MSERTAPGLPPASIAYAVVYLLTLAGSLGGGDLVTMAAVAGLLAFIALEIGRVRVAQLVAAGLLSCGGLLAAHHAGGAAGLIDGAYRGLHRALPFLVLFAAVMTLQTPALASPSFRAVGEAVLRQPPGRRFLVLAFAGHYLGAVLNLAGLQLVASLADPGMERDLRRRLIIAAVRGFSLAALWSPFFVGMGVILTLLPDASWLGVAPAGLPLGAGLIVLAWAFDRATRPRGGGTVQAVATTAAAPGQSAIPRAVLGVAAVFMALAIPVVTLSEAGGLSIVVALGLVAPPLALIWQSLLARQGATGMRIGVWLRDVLARLADLRNEAALFVGATIFGVGLATAIDAGALAQWTEAAGLPVWLRATLLTCFGTLVAGLGVHPVVLAILVGAVLPPAAIGLPAPALALVLAVIWALGTQMSPFSATVMQVARLLDVSVFRVAWLWNAPFCLPAAVIAGLAIGGFAAAAGVSD